MKLQEEIKLASVSKLSSDYKTVSYIDFEDDVPISEYGQESVYDPDVDSNIKNKDNDNGKSISIMPVEMVEVSGNENIKTFQMAKNIVSQSLYQQVMNENPSHFKEGNPTLFPVESIYWVDAVQFCNKLSEKEGLIPSYSKVGEEWTLNPNATGYRLPTKKEWQYAANGGINKNNFTFSGSNNENSVAWYQGNNPTKTTHELGLKQPNSLGIYDMSGNVWEWCWDQENGKNICCGGAYNSSIEEIKLNSYKNIRKVEEFIYSKEIGFRIVKSN